MRRRARPAPPPASPPPAGTRRAGVSRRAFTRGVAAGLAAAALGGCGRKADAAGPNPACTLYPEQTEGPFYLDGRLLRRDIAEGRPGVPLRLELQIVDASSCAPRPGVAVDVWHCDADGVYSGYPGQLGGVATTGQTFLRGTQLAGADGRVAFDTIYPGWYPGRTTHVHFKVRDGRSAATSQIYFPEEATAAVYARAPYAARGPKDTANAADAVVRFDGAPPLARVAGSAERGLVATLIVGVST